MLYLKYCWLSIKQQPDTQVINYLNGGNPITVVNYSALIWFIQSLDNFFVNVYQTY